jgi:hypothetical protein
MNPLAEEVHALLVVSAELKRRERLRPARRGSDAVPMLAFDGLQNASLTVAMTTAAGGGAAAAPARGQGGALPAATAAPSTCGTLATTPLSATLELAVYGLQLFSLTHLLLINGLASLEQRGALDPKAAGLHWLEPFRVWMAWTAVLTLDTGAASTMYPELSILQLVRARARGVAPGRGCAARVALRPRDDGRDGYTSGLARARARVELAARVRARGAVCSPRAAWRPDGHASCPPPPAPRRPSVRPSRRLRPAAPSARPSVRPSVRRSPGPRATSSSRSACPSCSRC